ncbi:MAG: ABC transporter permease [Christensenella sp.]|uniref:ABC transporter permease n=1 Tax=Christensenella sp. TaxID=1935934 RepID=UPI002B1F43C6|nr:ABC transporter permease [Christensenella sp.]MEA5002804.1 ABC transporter permease [Christensenella sp.]
MQSKDKAMTKHKIDWSKYIVYFAFAAMFIFFSIWLNDKGFVSVNNILNITRQTAMISIMAVAMTFVIAAAQIDLSVGAITALSSLTCALMLQSTNNVFLALIVPIALGIGIGAASGWLVTKFRIPAFLVTLGMMNIVRGSAMWITDTAAVPITNQEFCFAFGMGEIGGFPVLLLWTIVFVVFGALLLNKTSFGKKVLATGGNEVAARFTGIKVNKIKLLTFVMSGAFAAFAGILYSGRMQAGRYTFGDGDEMSVIAAVILGGTSMAGGTGSVIGAFVGSMLMGMINNGLILAGLSVSQQTIIRGVIIILAVALSNISRKKKD